MRTLLSVFLFTVLLLNLFGFYIAFVLNRENIRKEMGELIRKGNRDGMVAMKFTETEFAKIKWATPNKEFWLDDRFYDVSRTEFSFGQVILYVEEDKRETELLSVFLSTVNEQTRPDKDNFPLRILLSQFLNEFTIAQTLVIQSPSISSISIFEKKTCYRSFISDKFSPPPDTA